MARALKFGSQLARCSISAGQNKAVSRQPTESLPATRHACSPTSIAAPGYPGSPRSPQGQVRVLPVAASSGACREGGRADDPDPPSLPRRGGPASAPKSPAARRRRPRQAPGRLGIGVVGGQSSWETVTVDRRIPSTCTHGSQSRRVMRPHPLPSSWPSRGEGRSSHSLHSAGSLPQLCVQIDCSDSKAVSDLTSLLCASLSNDPGNWYQGQ